MPGRVFGIYRFTDQLVEDSLAQVFLATHRERSSAHLLVKLLSREVSAKTDIVHRFFTDVRATAELDHPGIARVFEAGYGPDRRAFVAMERLTGETLAARLQRHRILAPEKALDTALQIAYALDAAHARGLVHRGLAPRRIVLAADSQVPDREQVKLVDFGFAQLVEYEPGSVFASPRPLSGPLAYLAPEQRERSCDGDERVDLFALGCLLFQLLCGRPPFGADGVLATRHRPSRPPLPSRIVRGLAPQVDEIVHKLLAAEPEARPRSCIEVIDALDAARARPLRAALRATGRRRSQVADCDTALCAPRDQLSDGVPIALTEESQQLSLPSAIADASRAAEALPARPSIADGANSVRAVSDRFLPAESRFNSAALATAAQEPIALHAPAPGRSLWLRALALAALVAGASLLWLAITRTVP